MMVRTSASIFLAVSGETCERGMLAARPRKTSSSSSSYIRGPNFSDRPHLVTMARAILVALSMSLEAPVVMPSAPRVSSSAMRPPNKEQIWLWMARLLRE